MYEVDSKQFAEILDVSVQNLGYFKKQGMPNRREGNKTLFPLVDAIKWHSQNIQGSIFKSLCADTDIDDLSVDDQLKVKRMEKIELEMAITRGEYIPIDDVDETIARVSGLMIRQYRQHMRIFPKILARKSETQIKRILDGEFKKSVDTLREAFEAGLIDEGEENENRE